jgi:hypothetical protein
MLGGTCNVFWKGKKQSKSDVKMTVTLGPRHARHHPSAGAAPSVGKARGTKLKEAMSLKE